ALGRLDDPESRGVRGAVVPRHQLRPVGRRRRAEESRRVTRRSRRSGANPTMDMSSLDCMTAPALTLHEIADGVFVWLQPGGESGVSNAGAIVDEDGITVVDSLMVRSQWEPFAAAVAGLGRPVRRLVLTHAHIDHVGGSHAFPNASVIG